MLFNWFKKKDKIVSLKPLDSGQSPLKTNSLPKPGSASRLPGVKKAPLLPKDRNKSAAVSESAVIRIGKLGEVLLQYDMISRENLEKALAIQHESLAQAESPENASQKRKLLGEILIENNFVTEDQLLSAFARHCRIPYIKLNKYGLPKEAIRSLPRDLVVKHKVIPMDKIGSMLMLAVTDPYDNNAIDEIKAHTGLKVKTILFKQSEFAEMVDFYYPQQEQLSGEKASEAGQAVPKKTSPDKGENSFSEETAVFQVEELPFPAPPAIEPENETVTPKGEQAGTKPPEIKAAEKTEEVQSETPAPESPAEPISPDTAADTEIAEITPIENAEVPAKETTPGSKTESVPETSLSDVSSPVDENKGLPGQEPTPPEPTPESGGTDGHGASVIDIRDLIAVQADYPDENIELVPEEPEEPEKRKPETTEKLIEETKEPEMEVPVAGINTPTEPEPVPEIRPKEPVHEKESFRENPVPVSDEEFLMTEQLLSSQTVYSWEKLYHRSKPAQAEKVDENEFMFYTGSAVSWK